jgi:hypothetical protein
VALLPNPTNALVEFRKRLLFITITLTDSWSMPVFHFFIQAKQWSVVSTQWLNTDHRPPKSSFRDPELSCPPMATDHRPPITDH